MTSLSKSICLQQGKLLDLSRDAAIPDWLRPELAHAADQLHESHGRAVLLEADHTSAVEALRDEEQKRVEAQQLVILAANELRRREAMLVEKTNTITELERALVDEAELVEQRVSADVVAFLRRPN